MTNDLWIKSSYSGGAGSDCVETAIQAYAVRVRDSKDPAGPQIGMTPSAWSAFLAGVTDGVPLRQ